MKKPFKTTRREFLKIVMAGAALPMIGCGDDEGSDPVSPANNDPNNATNNDPNNTPNNEAGPDPELVFPQGLVSGDPKPESVILWTRVESVDGGEEAVLYEVATDEAFAEIVASGELSAGPETDHTLRLKVTGLDAFTTYFYRFEARGAVSATGRTRTAPAPDQDTPVRFAFASCQDFNGRFYHAWRALVEEDEVDFVVFLGDYIYETNNDPGFQNAIEGRAVTIPEGLALSEDGEVKAALTLNDYRSLYKQYRSDPDLKDAHRLFPFICIWDDHEFANDSWQDRSTHFNEAMGDEQDTDRRTAANQAWFEYQPADIERDASKTFPNDMTITRSLRFGRHVELFMTDQRSFRDDHVINEGPADLDVGKFDENTSLGSRNFVLKSGFDPKEAEVQPTMLGQDQKAWLIDGINTSTATWKFWGSETQLGQMLVDLSPFTDLPEQFQDTFYFSCDQWDGYRTERAEILSELSDTDNLVVLTGDIHAFYANELRADFDEPGDPSAVEFVVAGISSGSAQELTQRTVDGSPLLANFGLGELVPRFDELLQSASPHIQFAKSDGNGIAIVDVQSADAIEVTFMVVPDVEKPQPEGQTEKIRLRVAAGSNTIENL